jgi:hypothetical protein
MIYELISKVLINVLLISVFICIFFFTYGVHIEKLSISNQMKILAKNFMNFFQLSGEPNNKQLYDNINNNLLSKESIDKISEGDADALEGNNELIEKVRTYIIIFFCIVVGIIFVIFFFFVKNEDSNGDGEKQGLPGILTESLIILIFIGLTEFAFLTFFGAKYISLDVNHLKLELVKSLQKYSKLL